MRQGDVITLNVQLIALATYLTQVSWWALGWTGCLIGPEHLLFKETKGNLSQQSQNYFSNSFQI